MFNLTIERKKTNSYQKKNKFLKSFFFPNFECLPDVNGCSSYSDIKAIFVARDLTIGTYLQKNGCKC